MLASRIIITLVTITQMDVGIWLRDPNALSNVAALLIFMKW